VWARVLKKSHHGTGREIPKNRLGFFIKEQKQKHYKYKNSPSIMDIKIVLEEQEEGGYTVYVPSLPGCISQGETVEESLKNIKEAIELWLEPAENELIVYKDNVKIETIKL